MSIIVYFDYDERSILNWNIEIIKFHVKIFFYYPCSSDQTSVSEFVCIISHKYSFGRIRRKFVEVLLVVNYKLPATKSMKEMNIRFMIVQTFIWSLVNAFGYDSFVFYKARCCKCFCPEVERPVCKVEH